MSIVEMNAVAEIFANSLADHVMKARFFGYSDPEIADQIAHGFDAGDATGLVPSEDFAAFQRVCFEKMNQRLVEMSARTIVAEKFTLH